MRRKRIALRELQLIMAVGIRLYISPRCKQYMLLADRTATSATQTILAILRQWRISRLDRSDWSAVFCTEFLGLIPHACAHSFIGRGPLRKKCCSLVSCHRPFSWVCTLGSDSGRQRVCFDRVYLGGWVGTGALLHPR